jgi:NADH-quinone oxidoreductase subunit A
MTLIEAYLPIIFVGLISLGFAPAAWLTSRLIRPEKPSKWTEETYECGSVPIGDTRIQFRFQYYAFALIFVVFDLITTFLLIWAVAYEGLPKIATIYMLAFLGIMLLGCAYALKKEEDIWI